VNTDFKKWLQHILGREYRKLDPKGECDKINASATETRAMRELMSDFESHKKAFERSSPTMHIDLPKPLARLSIPRRVDQGDLSITKYVSSVSSCCEHHD
jgi:hypothetical protein